MQNPLKDLFYNFSQTIIDYLPNLFAGLLLIGVGGFLGWFAKRVFIQLCVIFRIDRLFERFRWGSQLSKGDVRHALYNSLGNIVLLIVFLIFLNNALSVMKLTVISNLLEMGIFFLPRLVTGLLILGIGWIISRQISKAIQKGLVKEDIPRATLISRFSKTVLLLFFSAMALTELNIAREIVIIGFTTVIITMGAFAIVITARGGKSLVNKLLQTLEEE